MVCGVYTGIHGCKGLQGYIRARKGMEGYRRLDRDIDGHMGRYIGLLLRHLH